MRLLPLLYFVTSTCALVAPERRSTRNRLLSLEAAAARKKWASPSADDDDDGSFSTSRAKSAPSRPTETLTEAPSPPVVPEKPKIVVLGASGKIGRRVVSHLMESSIDCHIVAFCRSYDKAMRVLYDDIVANKVVVKKKNGPKLQIVEGDLVPPEELPGFRLDDDEEEQDWLRRAESAAAFYGNKVSDYDNKGESMANEALEEAIRGCTCVISCVGDIRPTNVWTDFLARPFWRLLRKDVSSWCSDPRHPFYVHFSSTRKALAFAEREQLRREALMEEDDDGDDDEKKVVPRIRFVRISDLCVAQPAWQFIPVLANALHSMVFRYQDMAEKILHSSSVIETVVLRPGDLVDEERDPNTTSLQVSPDGKVPYPARVGRDDVAALAVAACLFDSSPKTSDQSEHEPPFHYTFAVRWTGQEMNPYPPQGRISDGMPTAKVGLQAALRTLRRNEKTKRRLARRQIQTQPTIVKFARSLPSVRGGKPYGLCVAVPVYVTLCMMVKTLLQMTVPHLPGGRTIVIPFALRMWSLVGLLSASILSRLQLVCASPQSLLAWLPRRSVQKYISF